MGRISFSNCFLLIRSVRAQSTTEAPLANYDIKRGNLESTEQTNDRCANRLGRANEAIHEYNESLKEELLLSLLLPTKQTSYLRMRFFLSSDTGADP